MLLGRRVQGKENRAADVAAQPQSQPPEPAILVGTASLTGSSINNSFILIILIHASITSIVIIIIRIIIIIIIITIIIGWRPLDSSRQETPHSASIISDLRSPISHLAERVAVISHWH